MKTPDINITPEILKLVAEIDEFKGKWSSLGQLLPSRLKIIAKLAKAESTGASLRLDGISCTDRQVGEIIAGHTTSSVAITAEQMEAIQGYLKIIFLIQKSYQKVSMAEAHIKQLHSIMSGATAQNGNGQGEYKQMLPGQGAVGVAPDQLTIAFKMRELMQWVNDRLNENTLHPLLITAIFLMKFHLINPFASGNGRMGRILLSLLLLRAGYTYTSYYSLEHVMERFRDTYLALVNNPLPEESRQLSGWLLFLCAVLKNQQERLVLKIDREKELVTLPDSSKQIMDVAKEYGECTISQILKSTGMNRNTLKIRLRKLVADNFLVQKGKGKGTRYSVSV